MDKEKIEPTVLIRKGLDYFVLKTSPKDIEAILNGNDKMGKYQLPFVMDKLESTDLKIPNKKLNTYGQPVPVREPIMTPDGFVDRKTLADAIHKFFHSALSLAHIYKSPYVAVDKMKIYEMTRGEVIVYEVNGLAQLLRKI